METVTNPALTVPPADPSSVPSEVRIAQEICRPDVTFDPVLSRWNETN